MRKYWTMKHVMAFRPCYDEATIQAWFPGRKRVTLLDVLRHDGIDAVDRIWFATRPGVLRKADRLTWLNVVIERAVRNHALKCGVPKVERWAKAWLDGTDRSADAAYAAYAAYAAWAAADAAAYAAAYAAWAAADAAWAAADAAAYAAAYAAERQQQVKDLLAILEAQ